MILDIIGLKRFIEQKGIKQKAISEKSGIPEVQMSLILQGKRKCEAGEYASICNTLDIPMHTFVKPRLPDKEVN